MNYGLDIETIGVDDIFSSRYIDRHVDKRLKDTKKIEENKVELKDKLALSPLTGRVILVGIAVDGAEVFFNNASEVELLYKTIDFIHVAYNKGSRMITFNGKSFDIPFIVQRAIIHKIPFPIEVFSKLMYPYNHEYHIDIRSFFPKGTLNEIAYLLGDGGSIDDSSGNVIQEYYEVGKLKEIEEKCRKDLKKLMLFNI